MANVLATIIVSRKSKIEQFPGPLVIEPDSEVTIGRSTSCSLSFPDFKHISHVHCHIRNKDGQVQLKSVSSNKTLLDSKPVNKDEWTKLRDGNTITLCADPKVRLDVRLGSGVRDSPVKKRKHTAKRSTAIAEITSLGNADLEYLVKPSSKHSRDVSVTIGRAKDCDVSIDDKKVSSTHVKLVFTRVEGESIHWDLQVEAVATRNKTYVGNELVEESKTIKSFSDPIDVCLVFPRGEKPVEVLTVSPLFVEAEPSSQEEKAPLTAAEMIQQELEKAEKRQKKELRELEKQSKVWKVEYEKEIQKFQDVEHSLIRDTEVIEGHIRAKHGEISVLSAAVSQLESEMTDKQNSFKEQLSSAKSEHESRIVQYTAALSETVARLQKLMDEKLKIQMNMSLEVQMIPEDIWRDRIGPFLAEKDKQSLFASNSGLYAMYRGMVVKELTDLLSSLKFNGPGTNDIAALYISCFFVLLKDITDSIHASRSTRDIQARIGKLRSLCQRMPRTPASAIRHRLPSLSREDVLHDGSFKHCMEMLRLRRETGK